MRNFTDSWASILDDRGKFLKGRVTFYEAGSTTSKKTVYATDGTTVLPNPIYTDEFGKTVNQVLLDDSDYTIVFERYIGNGQMEGDNSEASWFPYKTILSKNGTFTIQNDMSAVQAVVGMEALKNIDGMVDKEIVQVFGYYEATDCPPRYFMWHDHGQVSFDGGVTVASNKSTTGFWRMIIPGDYIDVRWFGDIPSASTTGTSSNLSQRAKAATAANINKKNLYFPALPGIGGISCYVFDGSNTVSVTKDIICDNSVRFVVKTGTTGTKVSCHELKKCEKYLFVSTSSSVAIGGYSLECDWINTSWFNSSRVNADGAKVGYVIDLLNSALNFTNTKIKFERDGLNKENVRFDNCEFVDCHENIDRPTIFVNMEIKQSWFDKDFDFVANCSYSGCKILLRNFNDADTYIKMKNKQYERDYGDLGEQSLHNALVYPGGTIENCYGSITLPSQTSGEYEMHNCSLTINNITANKKFNLVDCWITVPSSAECLNLSMRRGSIIVTGTNRLQVISNAYFNDVDIAGYIYAPGADCFITNSRISGHVTNTNIQLYNSIVTGVVESWVTEGKSIKFNVIGNTFSKGGYHYVNTQRNQGDKFDVTCDGVWSNNTADYADKHWIVARRWGMGTGSLYMYTNNGQPYFDRMNRVAIKFYGICINVDTDHADKSRVRTDIPLVMFNKSERDFYFANFTVYAFSLRGAITTNRLRLSSADAKGLLDQSGNQSNAIVFSPASTLVAVPNSGDNFDYKFTSYELSPLTDIDHKYKLGARLGFANNATNIEYYTRSLSLWQTNMPSGLPAAVVNVYFDVNPNDVTVLVSG